MCVDLFTKSEKEVIEDLKPEKKEKKINITAKVNLKN